MGGFDFRLERILRLRETLKEDRARTLRDARGEADAADAALDALHRARAARPNGTDPDQPLTAGELAAAHEILSLIDRHIEAGMRLRDETDQRVERALRDLEAAHGEERALEILRERAHARWAMEERRREQAAADGAPRPADQDPIPPLSSPQ